MGKFSEGIIRAFEAGQRARLEEQEQARRDKLEELAQQDRKAQMEHLKVMEQISKATLAAQNRARIWGEAMAMQGKIAGKPTPISIPNFTGGAPTPAGTAQGKIPDMYIPPVPGMPGVPGQPEMYLPIQNQAEAQAQFLSDLAQKLKMEQEAKVAAESFASPVDLPGIKAGQRVSPDQAKLSAGVFDQLQANWRAQIAARGGGEEDDPSTPENQKLIKGSVMMVQSGLLKPTEAGQGIGRAGSRVRKAFQSELGASPDKPIPPDLKKAAQAFAKHEALINLMENGGVAEVPKPGSRPESADPKDKESVRLPGILEVSSMSPDDRIKWSYIWDAYVNSHSAEISRTYGDVGNISIVEREISTKVFPGWKSINFAPGLAKNMLATLKIDAAQRKRQTINAALSTLRQDPVTGEWNFAAPGTASPSTTNEEAIDLVWSTVDGKRVLVKKPK